MAEQTKGKAGDAGEAVQPPKKPSKIVPMAMVLVGLLLGGGGASGYFLFANPMGDAAADAGGDAEAPAEPEGPPVPPTFVEINRLTVPLVTSDGQLSAYMNLELKFEVAQDEAEFVKARIPMVRHAINGTLSQTSIADANNPQLLDYALAQKVLREAVNQALGKAAVRSVQITRALPI